MERSPDLHIITKVIIMHQAQKKKKDKTLADSMAVHIPLAASDIVSKIKLLKGGLNTVGNWSVSCISLS